ncbi:MAG: MarC family protein [Alphaproteobacteria bacterium]|nr:MarC family protein [Alphaproteobacteria bacterium]
MFAQLDLREFVSAFVVLFAIIDITGSIPIVINMRKKGKIVSSSKASFISFIMFIGFFYLGDAFLRLFGLDISSFAVAGSVILFIMALEMILDIQIFRDSPDLPKDATFTPVVFPLIVGAGSMTALLSLRAEFADINILTAILANVVVVYFALKMAKKFEHLINPGVIYMLQKVFGIILLAISVKLFLTNLSALIKAIY